MGKNMLRGVLHYEHYTHTYEYRQFCCSLRFKSEYTCKSKTTCKYTIINTLKKNPDYLQYVFAGYFYHCNISLEIAVAINLVRVFVWSISFRDGCVIKHTKLCSDSSHILYTAVC